MPGKEGTFTGSSAGDGGPRQAAMGVSRPRPNGGAHRGPESAGGRGGGWAEIHRLCSRPLASAGAPVAAASKGAWARLPGQSPDAPSSPRSRTIAERDFTWNRLRRHTSLRIVR